MIRKSTVYVSEKDKKLLLRYCEEIEKILEKYPYSNDYSEYFVTAMTRTKNAFSEMKLYIECLDIKH